MNSCDAEGACYLESPVLRRASAAGAAATSPAASRRVGDHRSRQSDVDNKERAREEEEQEEQEEEEVGTGGQQQQQLKGRVTVFSVAGCPHCKRAKALLRELDLPVTEIDLGKWPGRRGDMVQRTGQRSVPQVFFNEVHIGGAEQLQQLRLNGKLNAYIDLVRNNAAPESAPNPPEEEIEESDEAEDVFNVDITCEPDEFSDLVDLMRRPVSEGGLSIKDRRYHLRSYRSCFIGNEAVDWLLQQKSLQLNSREEALQLGNRMLKNHHFHHVLYDHDFEDRYLFYRFLQDEDTSPKTLNSSQTSTCAPMDASELSRTLRQLVLSLYDQFLSDDGSAVDYEGIAKSDTWRIYRQQTAELRRTDISALGREEKLAFFINIYNALVIHAYVEVGPPTRFWQRLTFFRRISYVIGGHVFSLNDIEHGILRANASGPGSSRHQFGKNDPRVAYCLAQRDPRVHFALVCGAKSCPSIRTYTPDQIDEQLDEATRTFFEDDDSLRVDTEKRCVHLSKLLSWYGEDFGATPKDRMLWVAKYAPADKAQALTSVVNNGKFKLAFLPYDWSANSRAQ